jgi:hypothetical protein
MHPWPDEAARYGVDVSDFPPPPPPSEWSAPPQQPAPASPPPLSTPPPVIWDAAPPASTGWLRRKRFQAPTWVWLAVVLALVGVGVGIAVGSGKDDKKDAVSVATSESESTDTPTESTSPSPVTDSIAPTESTEPSPVTEATDEPTTEEVTIPSSSKEVPGTPAGIKGSRTSPVPAGAVADIGGGWRLQILNVNPDAAAAVAAENEFNDPPPDGSTYTLITVAVGYFGVEDPKSQYDTTIEAVGSSNVQLTGSCGSLPQELDTFGDLFSGGVLVGNICFVTTPQDAASLQLYASGDPFGSDDQVYLDASTAPANAVPMASLTGAQPGAQSTPKRTAPTAVGTVADVGDGWKVSVTGAATDITDAVMAQSEFNAPPPDGYRYIGLNVTYAYSGDGPGSAFSVTAKGVGASNLQLSNQCGEIPNDIDLSADIFAGGSVSGTLCFVAPAADPTFVLYATADFSSNSVMFAVN